MVSRILWSKVGVRNGKNERKRYYLTSVKSNKRFIINAAFFLVELPLGYML